MQTPPDKPAALATVSLLALLLAELDPTVGPRLLAEHTADHLGHCRRCSMPQGGPQSWPCSLFTIGTQMQQHARTRRLPGR